jgi:hypothetical protein
MLYKLSEEVLSGSAEMLSGSPATQLVFYSMSCETFHLEPTNARTKNLALVSAQSQANLLLLSAFLC